MEHINQKLLNALITRHIDLMRYETSVRAEVFAKMDEMQDDVWGFVLSGSLKKVEHIITQGYELLLKMWDVLPVFSAEMAWLSATLGGLAVAYKLKDKIVPFAQNKLKDLADKFTIGGLTLPESVAKQRDDLIIKLKQVMRFAQIDDILPSKEEIQSIFNGFKNRAKTLSKTWINSAVHTAHDAFAKVNPMIKGFRHVSTLDGKTSSVCTHRNGLLWDKKHKPIGHAETFKRPPLHPNCRSKMVYVYDLDKPFDGMTGADWVKSRSLKQLQDQFGVGVGKMLFDGEIDLADALDGLKPLTLKQLQDKADAKRFDFKDGVQNYQLGDRIFSSVDLAKLSGAVDGSEIEITSRANHFLYHAPVLEIFAEHKIYDGRLHRLISIDKNDNLILHNEMQFLHQEYQGQKIATYSLVKQIDMAKQLGVKNIQTYAIRSKSSNGYYTWARLGFDADLLSEILIKLPADFAHAKRISDLMQTEQGQKWWFENGISHNMIFDLHDGSYSLKIFQEYLDSRKNNHG